VSGAGTNWQAAEAGGSLTVGPGGKLPRGLDGRRFHGAALSMTAIASTSIRYSGRQRLHAYHRVGWPVVSEQRDPGRLDDRQVLGAVVDDVERDLGDLPGAGTDRGEGHA
jgi:hypothetical protein